jgi:DNA-binding response OmpR family regulator
MLLIDDDAGLRLLLKKGLAAQGHCLYEASDGVAGLEQFHAIQPDLLLLDITMPRLDGFAVLKEIRQYNPVVGIIMTSALSSRQFAAEAMIGGADSYLSKPLRFPHVLTEVQRVKNLIRLRQYSQARQQRLADTNQRLQCLFTRETAPTTTYPLRADQVATQSGTLCRTATILCLDYGYVLPPTYQRQSAEVSLLNQLLTFTTMAIMNHGGYIDKFTGDSFIAVFDADHLPDHATYAVRAAVQIHSRLQQLDQAGTLQIRVGIHSGEITWMPIGIPQFINYTAFGDTVNQARYLKEFAAPTTTLLSAESYKLLALQTQAGEQMRITYWGDLSFAWRQSPTPVYQVQHS